MFGKGLVIRIFGVLAGLFAGCSFVGCAHPHWSYEGAGAPQHWGDLSPEFKMCKEGKSQSPIDITGAQTEALPEIKFDYASAASTMVNNGHSIQVNFTPGSKIAVGDKTYELLQFHFHTPSEHTVDGKPTDMVAHLVHKAADGRLGVIGVLMKAGAENPTIAKLWAKLPTKKGEQVALDADGIKADGILPAEHGYYSYIGSLTTPPCSENVAWMVLKTPLQVSAEQAAAFTKVFPKSVRPVQPLNGRVIKVSQ